MATADQQLPSDLRNGLMSALTRGDLAEAERLAVALLARGPDIDALNVLGLIELNRGRRDLARAHFVRAISLAPQAPPPTLNLALIFHGEGRLESARQWSRRARHLDPALVDAYATEASVERLLGRQPAAAPLLRRALSLAPGVPEFLANAGNLLLDAERLEPARRMFRRALAVTPGHGAARFELACLDLGDGKFERGWTEYEARFEAPALVRRRPFPQPLWSGEPVDSLLVWAEQGMGDEILFAALLPDAARHARRLTVECDPRLVSIFQRSFPAMQIRPRLAPPDPALLSPAITRQTPMGSLPRLLWRSIATGRTSTAYLLPHPERVAAARRWLSGLGAGPKIGIAWRSGRFRDPTAARLSTALAQWDPILATPGAVFVNLQYGDCGAEIDDVERRLGTRIHRMPGLDLFHDLEGTVALSASLDLVISATITPYTFPAAAGVETWLLRFESDYMARGPETYAWLRSVRSFVRGGGASWAGPIGEAATALRVWIERRPAASSSRT
jgi:Flp pilus assembly protein TadD